MPFDSMLACLVALLHLVSASAIKCYVYSGAAEQRNAANMRAADNATNPFFLCFSAFASYNFSGRAHATMRMHCPG